MGLKHYFFLLFYFIFFLSSTYSQSYFQQEVNSTIHVQLDDKKHELFANISIEYINNSSDSLTEIFMHLWPNAYKDNTTALAKQLLENSSTKLYYSNKEERGYIDGLDFKVNGEKTLWQYDKEFIDIGKIILKKPLKTGEKLIISTPFHVKIPKGIFSRLGHIGQSYQITQWYPKPAVYDKEGWHPMPYLNQGEFYSEFGSFDVAITLPKNYVVGATGDLYTTEELEWLNEKAYHTSKNTTFLNDNSFPKSDTALKTIRYKQSNVHDFAWFADKRFHVLRGEVTLPHSKRTVTTWAMFTNAEADLWKNSIAYLNDAIYYYSLWNGDYPYNQMTAVDGALSAGGGMEYPNITTIPKTASAFFLESVIMHETGHQWFYGILGTNERVHPWMDEGINSFYENRYIETKYPNATLLGDDLTDKQQKLIESLDLSQYKHKAEYELGYLMSAKDNNDQPITLHATKFTDYNYGAIVYYKSAVVFDYLMAYLGEVTFDKAMQQYFETWKFKHPQPKDFREIMEKVADKKLSWFFDDILNTTKKLDYKIVKAKTRNDSLFITIKNKGEVNSPFTISGITADTINTTVWNEGIQNKGTISFPNGGYDKLRIDAHLDIPEMSRNNNTLKTKGILKRTEPLRLQFLGSLDNPDKTQLFFTPVIGWNNYNKTMMGIAFYNRALLKKKTEYIVMPMYGSGTNNLNGTAKLLIHLFDSRDNAFRKVSPSISFTKYNFLTSKSQTAYFTKIVPQITFFLKKREMRNPTEHTLNIRSTQIKETYSTIADNNKTAIENNFYYEINYSLMHNTTINPSDISIQLQQGNEFMKTSLEVNHKISFKKSNKGIHLRIFAGKFLYNDTNHPKYNWKIDGQGGNDDYTYDEIFLGRNESEGILSKQFIANQGGFKVLSAVGQSNNWLAAINLKIDIPTPLPIGIFYDVGMNGDKIIIGNNKETIFFDAGLYFPIAKKVFVIYMPLFFSNSIKTYHETNNITFVGRIRFTLYLNKLNPFEWNIVER